MSKVGRGVFADATVRGMGHPVSRLSMRLTNLAMTVTFIVGCSAGGSSRDVSGSSGDSDAGGVPDTSLSSDGRTLAPECDSDIPCTNSTQCVALPGFSCNENTNRCQKVLCGKEGANCSRNEHCEKGSTCTGSYCTSESCESTCATSTLKKYYADYACGDEATRKPFDIQKACELYCTALASCTGEAGSASSGVSCVAVGPPAKCIRLMFNCASGVVTAEEFPCPG